jgi:hypothetical protein
MTRIGPTDVVMPACGRAAAYRVSVLTVFRALGSVWRALCEPTSAGPAFPSMASVKPSSGRPAGRSGRFRSASQRSRCPRVSEQHLPSSPAYRFYSHLLKRRGTALYGCSVDPGRAMLCTVSSPRWPQWP